MTDDERGDWEGLIHSPGWLRLLEHARLEWKEDYPRKMKLARMEAKASGEDAGQAMDRVDAAQDAINQFLDWPKHRLGILEANKARNEMEPSVSRRGRGL